MSTCQSRRGSPPHERTHPRLDGFKLTEEESLVRPLFGIAPVVKHALGYACSTGVRIGWMLTPRLDARTDCIDKRYLDKDAGVIERMGRLRSNHVTGRASALLPAERSRLGLVAPVALRLLVRRVNDEFIDCCWHYALVLVSMIPLLRGVTALAVGVCPWRFNTPHPLPSLGSEYVVIIFPGEKSSLLIGVSDERSET